MNETSLPESIDTRVGGELPGLRKGVDEILKTAWELDAKSVNIPKRMDVVEDMAPEIVRATELKNLKSEHKKELSGEVKEVEKLETDIDLATTETILAKQGIESVEVRIGAIDEQVSAVEAEIAQLLEEKTAKIEQLAHESATRTQDRVIDLTEQEYDELASLGESEFSSELANLERRLGLTESLVDDKMAEGLSALGSRGEAAKSQIDKGRAELGKTKAKLERKIAVAEAKREKIIESYAARKEEAISREEWANKDKSGKVETDYNHKEQKLKNKIDQLNGKKSRLVSEKQSLSEKYTSADARLKKLDQELALKSSEVDKKAKHIEWLDGRIKQKSEQVERVMGKLSERMDAVIAKGGDLRVELGSQQESLEILASDVKRSRKSEIAGPKKEFKNKIAEIDSTESQTIEEANQQLNSTLEGMLSDIGADAIKVDPDGSIVINPDFGAEPGDENTGEAMKKMSALIQVQESLQKLSAIVPSARRIISSHSRTVAILKTDSSEQRATLISDHQEFMKEIESRYKPIMRDISEAQDRADQAESLLSTLSAEGEIGGGAEPKRLFSAIATWVAGKFRR